MADLTRLTGRLLVLIALLAVWLPAAQAEEFLRPEQAFQVSGKAAGPNHVAIRWKIADGYYLYQSKLRFRSETLGVAPGEAELPPAEIKDDPIFGEVPIYRGSLEVTLPLTRDPGSEHIVTLETTSQGCADAGLCYPPQRQKLLIELPEPAAAEPAPRVSEEPPSGLALSPASESPFGQSLGMGGEDEILDVAEAFRFQAEAVAPDRLQLTWDVAPGTYLYRHLVKIGLEGPDGVTLGDFQLPPGDVKHDAVLPDGSIGDVEVYHGRVDLTLPLRRTSGDPADVTLVAKYQGCAEIGICYPPQTQRVTLSLPAAPDAMPAAASTEPASGTGASGGKTEGTASTAPAPRAASTAPVSEQDRIASVLAGGSLWTILAVFFGFGLLLAFTPCIFPMIPILSGIIAGHGANITTRKAFVLSLVYVLAMALTYTLVGVLAGLFGANLQAWFQNPWILSTFALIFVLLALSMFGFYDLQMPSALQSRLAEISNRQRGGTLLGVAIMGLLSALIVGPCVAPPLFGALIYISQTGDALLGGLALFALSLGMGAPLIAIGTSAGKLLPRAGIWMDAVKAVFGVTLLGVAILLLERILPPAVAMLLWGLLLICSAIYMGALTSLHGDASGWRKLWKGIGFALLVYGALMLVGAAAGGKDTLQPLRGLVGVSTGGAAAQHASFQRIKTSQDLDRALARAQTSGQPVMLDFYADWCVSCKEMERYTFSDPDVIAEMGRFLLLQADVTANDDADRALMQERFGIPGPPAILFFDPAEGELRNARLVGFKPADAFLAHLRGIAPSAEPTHSAGVTP